MKKLLLFVLLLNLSQQAFCQNQIILDTIAYDCRYLLTFQPDSTDVDSKMTEEMILSIGKKVSRFESLNSQLRDSVIKTMTKNNSFLDMSQVPKTRFKSEIFKNYPNGKVTYFEKILKDNLQYQEPLDLFNWKIENERKEIAGYSCQKATTNFAGRDYVAWFAEEIPITEGPYKFNGLPGLIMEISDTKNHYNYELISFKKATKGEVITITNKSIEVTKQEFEKIKKDFQLNPLKKLANLGFKLEGSNSQKQKMRERIKKRNNPIELK